MIEKVVLNGEEHKLSPDYKDIRNKPSINGVELKEGDNKIEIIDINVDPDVDIVEEGETPSVINTGTSKNPTLKFSLPKGEQGDKGKVYVPNVDEESGDLSWSLEDNPQSPDSTNIKGPQGERGVGLNVTAIKAGKVTNVSITTDAGIPQLLETLQIIDGNDGHNPCLGRFSSVQSTFVETLRAGDYYYVDTVTDNTTNPPTIETKIYRYNGLEWDDGTVVNVSNISFNSGQSVIGTGIKDINGDNDPNAAGVLSAEAGKTIAETTMELETGLNILNLAGIKVGKRIAASDGGEYNVSSTNTPKIYGCTDYIEIGDGVICNHTIKYINGIYYRGAAIYDSQKRFIGTKSANEFGGELLITKDMTGWSGTAATGADTEHPYYVRFNLYNPASDEGGVAYDGVTDGYAVYRATELPTPAFQPWHEPYWKQKAAPIQDGAVTTAKITDGAVTPQKTSFFKNVIVSNNILDPNTVKYGVKVNRNTGLESDSTIVYCTDFISIDEKGLYINHAVSQSGVSDGGCVIYNASKEYIRSRSASSFGSSLSIPYEDGAAYVRFNIPNIKAIDTVYVCRGTQPLPDGYEPYEEQYCVDPDYVLSKGLVSAKEIVDAANAVGVYSQAVQISLPDRIYGVIDDTLQIFYQGIVVVPNIEMYDITINCSKGKGLYRYYELTPETTGTYTWAINVKDANGNILSTKTCQLAIVDKPSSPSTQKNILCVGDSLTAGGGWVAEMKRRLTGVSGTGTPAALGLNNINLIGSQHMTKNGTEINLEAHSGWGWTDYDDYGRPLYRFYLDGIYNVSKDQKYTNNSIQYTVREVNNESGKTIILTSARNRNNTIVGTTLNPVTGSSSLVLNFERSEEEPANPFWNDSEQKLDFVNYVENTCGLPQGTNIDYVLFCMTYNDIPGVDEDWTDFETSVKTVLDALHTDYSDCLVKLIGVEFIYPNTHMGDGANQDRMAAIRKVAKMHDFYQELANSEEQSGTSGDAYNSFVEFISVSTQFDSRYNMTIDRPRSSHDVNTRNSEFKELFTTNTVHPTDSGYLQIADVAYRAMCAALQGEDN